MSALRSDLTVALRSLRRAPAFTLTALATLALAIGLNGAVFSLVRGLLLRELPFADAERLTMVWEASETQPRNVVNPGNYLRWTEEAKSFSALAGMAAWSVNLGGEGSAEGAAAAERVPIGYVTKEFFETAGAPALVGRTFTAADVAEGAPNVVVLSEPLWRSRYGRDPAVIGREITINGEKSTIVGVVGAEFDLPAGAQIWEPMAMRETARAARGRYLQVLGRLAPGATVASAAAEMKALALRLVEERPDFNAGWSANVVPLEEQLVGDHRRGLWVLLGAVGAVLLVACANLSGLQLARNARRSQELAVRSALGAGRGELARQLLVESALLVGAGALLGLVVARALIGALPALLPLELPRFARVELDGAVLAFTLGATALAALLVGLAPALRASRAGLADALATGTARGGSQAGGFARSTLVVAQVALSIALVAAASLLVRSFDRLRSLDTGMALDGLIAAEVNLAGPAYRESASHVAFFSALEEKLGARGELEKVGAISWLPLGSSGSATGYRALDQPPPAPEDEPVADVRVVTPGFFGAADVKLLAGRFLAPSDDGEAPTVVVINEAGARELWPDRAPADVVGRKIGMEWGEMREATVVGVVAHVRLTKIDDAPRGTLYWPLPQLPNSFMTFLVRAKRGEDGQALAARALRESVAALDPSIPVAKVQPMVRVVDRAVQRPRFTSSLLALFAATALLLAALGLYGLLAGAVAERQREIGVRMALGADARRVLATVVGRALALVAAGVVLGVPLVLLSGRWLGELLFELTPTDPFALAVAPLALLAVAAFASALPALRAARTDPASVLRQG